MWENGFDYRNYRAATHFRPTNPHIPILSTAPKRPNPTKIKVKKSNPILHILFKLFVIPCHYCANKWKYFSNFLL